MEMKLSFTHDVRELGREHEWNFLAFHSHKRLEVSQKVTKVDVRADHALVAVLEMCVYVSVAVVVTTAGGVRGLNDTKQMAIPVEHNIVVVAISYSENIRCLMHRYRSITRASLCVCGM
jgi:hypothetical protein